jgi:hypothetical protein
MKPRFSHASRDIRQVSWRQAAQILRSARRVRRSSSFSLVSDFKIQIFVNERTAKRTTQNSNLGAWRPLFMFRLHSAVLPGRKTVVRQKQDFDNEKLLARQAVFLFQHCMKNVLIGQLCFSENKKIPSAGRVRIL